MSDYDSPWKEALELFFYAFLEFFFPEVHAAVDWDRKPEALDTELQQIVREAALGRRQVDKLFKVWLHQGAEVWILIHVEIQTQRDEAFPERMFVYHYRLYDRTRQPLLSLAVLGDEQAAWRPRRFGYKLYGCEVSMDFPTVKLLDYAGNLSALEAVANPFAPLVLAHLKTLETRGDSAARYNWKFRVIRGLYERGFRPEQVCQLFRLIDWMMDLPVELEQQLQQALLRLEEEKHMPYVTSIERFAEQRGREVGLAEGEQRGREVGLAEGEQRGRAAALLQILERRFPSQVPADLSAAIWASRNPTQLERGVDLAMQAGSLEEFRQAANL